MCTPAPALCHEVIRGLSALVGGLVMLMVFYNFHRCIAFIFFERQRNIQGHPWMDLVSVHSPKAYKHQSEAGTRHRGPGFDPRQRPKPFHHHLLPPGVGINRKLKSEAEPRLDPSIPLWDADILSDSS